MTTNRPPLQTSAPFQILQTGTYNSMNKGDAAMQLSTADALTGTLPGARVLISTPFPEVDRGFYRNYEVTKCSRRRLIWASLQLLRAAVWNLFDRIGLPGGWLIPEQELREYLAADLIVDLSGDMLTEDYGPHVAYSHYTPLLLAILFRRPFVVCAQSVGPFQLTRPLARFILNSAASISTRDQISFDYLTQVGVSPTLLHKTADMAFLLRPIEQNEALSLLAEEGFTVQEGRSLFGVSLSQLVESRYAKNNPHGKDEDFVTFFASVLDKIADAYNVDFLFVPHVTGPSSSKDDRRIHARIMDRMAANGHVITGDYSPSQLKGMISLCQTMLGARMHANIGALSCGIPTVAIAYSHKTPGIMESLGLGELVLDIDTLGREPVLQKVQYLYENREALTTQLNEALIRTRNAAQENVDMIVRLLRSGRFESKERPIK